MANIQKMFKEEIRRVAKKEVKAAAGSLRTEIGKLHRQIRLQNEQISQMRQGTGLTEVVAVSAKRAEEAVKEPRMSNERIKRIRLQCGLTQVQFARLLGVSHSSVAKWEIDKAQPRTALRLRIIAFGKMGKRKLQKYLEKLDKIAEPVQE